MSRLEAAVIGGIVGLWELFLDAIIPAEDDDDGLEEEVARRRFVER